MINLKVLEKYAQAKSHLNIWKEIRIRDEFNEIESKKKNKR